MEINAITLVTSDMSKSVAFWEVVGLATTYGGPSHPFSSLAFGSNFVNLQLVEGAVAQAHPRNWGRVVFHVDSPDALWEKFRSAGYPSLTEPKDAAWGERYFHIADPDGHELSFACRLEGHGR